MSDIKEYYQTYHSKGGLYRLEDYKGSSRPLMIQHWLTSNLKPGAKVLDIGCGDGMYSQWMPQFQWTGIDINAERVAYRGNRLTHDLENTPYPLQDAQYDAVICSEVLEHLFTPEKVHSEAQRLLKPKGIYVISTPNFDWIEHHLGMFRQVLFKPGETHTREHIRFYNIEVHQQMLDKAGFSVVDYCGADTQFSKFFEAAREQLKKEMPLKQIGEIDFLLGKMFPLVQHTLGVLSVRR